MAIGLDDGSHDIIRPIDSGRFNDPSSRRSPMPRSSTALAREIRVIRTSFRRLARSFSKIAPLLGEHQDVVVKALSNGGRPRRKPRLSAQRRAELKLQGKYLGTMRGLKPRQRAQVKKIRATKGILAAIASAKAFSNK
jgi:hypothetical protein